MLKKLVKYGNSNALIFDKAILELLEIGEGSTLKIKTDGKSLIITLHSPVVEEKISPSPASYIDAINEGMLDQVMRQYSALTPERRAVLTQELKELHAKLNTLIAKAPEYPSFVRAKDVLARKHVDSSSPEFQREYIELRNRLVPEIAVIDDQILNFEKVHNLDPSGANMSPSLSMRPRIYSPESMQQLQDGYAAIFKKHTAVYGKFVQMTESPDFIHEMQLLTEKFEVNSPEYKNKMFAIRYKYVPEVQAMDEEMAELSTKILGTQTCN